MDEGKTEIAQSFGLSSFEKLQVHKIIPQNIAAIYFLITCTETNVTGKT
jgi:hypothetical protein